MHHETQLQLNELMLRKGKAILRAINHSLRRKIIALIHQNGRITVTNIYHELEIEQSAASQHLALLREAGIVKAQRERRNIYYSVNYERIQQIEGVASN